MYFLIKNVLLLLLILLIGSSVKTYDTDATAALKSTDSPAETGSPIPNNLDKMPTTDKSSVSIIEVTSPASVPDKHQTGKLPDTDKPSAMSSAVSGSASTATPKQISNSNEGSTENMMGVLNPLKLNWCETKSGIRYQCRIPILKSSPIFDSIQELKFLIRKLNTQLSRYSFMESAKLGEI